MRDPHGCWHGFQQPLQFLGPLTPGLLTALRSVISMLIPIIRKGFPAFSLRTCQRAAIQ